MAKKRKVHTLVISGRQKADPTILQAIAGSEDIADSSINIVESYFARERYENLVEQGYDVTQKGFAKVREKIYGGSKETIHRKSDWNMEDAESKRADRDPFDTPHLVKEPSEMEDLVMERTYLDFISEAKPVEIELHKAKLRIVHGQKYTDEMEFVSEWTNIELTNNDLEERYQYRMSSKVPMILNFTPKQGEQVIEIPEGIFRISRSEDRKTVSISIDDKVRTYKNKDGSNIWIAERKYKEDLVTVDNDPWATL